MARILVQTDNRRTVLEERSVDLAEIGDDAAAADLMSRLKRAVADAERPPATRPRPRVQHLAAIVPAMHYRDVCG